MTIENIIRKIDDETKAEVGNILAEVKNEAKEIKLEAQKRIRADLKSAQEQGEKRITIMRNIHLSEARRTARKTTLSAKEELIDQCFTQAKERLKTMKGEEYRSVLTRLIKESLPHIGDKGLVTLTRDEDKSIINSFPNLKVKPELAPGLGGLIIESADGRIIVDNTFDAILERNKDDIRTEVATILYPEEKKDQA